ncbi:hypothetical protein BH10PSE14_BH10PSE14_03980 [soil metagenome]
MSTRRDFIRLAAAAPLAGAISPTWAARSAQLSSGIYAKALELAVRHVRGGPGEPIFKQPFVDAAFSDHIFLWDSCFIAAYAKYHLDRLPIAGALDNFYRLQEADGFICREYDAHGNAFWPKDHPVSVNPPLLAFAELEIFGHSRDRARLRGVYPHLIRHFDFLVGAYRQSDDLFFSDAFGSGMDNIKRYPEGWQDDGQGIPLVNLYPDVFAYEGLSPKWNRQGRSVDFTAQMILFAQQLRKIGGLIGEPADDARLATFVVRTGDALNERCWSEADGFYYDLGYGTQIPRMHIGMFWTLWAGIVSPERQLRMIRHLFDPRKFWRTIPVASTPGDSPDFDREGGYWRGSVWAPTNYMIIRGLRACGHHAHARRLALRYYSCVAQVYEATGTFWENYAPDALAPGSQAKRDFCGWTALAPITLCHEYLAARALPHQAEASAQLSPARIS